MIVLDGVVPQTWCEEIWASDAANPLGIDRGDVPQGIQPPAGGTTFRMTTLLPHDQMMALMAKSSPEERRALSDDGSTTFGEDGFHRTDTLDYILVLDGPVELVLDDASVMLEPGDAVVQRRTNHAWKNHGDSPIRLLNVMVSLH